MARYGVPYKGSKNAIGGRDKATECLFGNAAALETVQPSDEQLRIAT